MKNLNFRTVVFSVLLLAAVVTGVGNAALTRIFWSDLDTTHSSQPTTLTGYGITDAASDAELATHEADTSTHGVQTIAGATETQTLTNKTISDDSNTITDLALSALKTVVGEANTFLSRDGSGVATAAKAVPSGVVVGTTDTQTLTNKSISGEQINSGTVADARIASTLARDSEVTTEISNHTASTTSVHGLPSTMAGQANKHLMVNGTENGFSYVSGAVLPSREDVTIGGTATTTVTLSSITVNSYTYCYVYINGILQKASNFTKTSSTVLTSGVGTIASASLVTVVRFD